MRTCDPSLPVPNGLVPWRSVGAAPRGVGFLLTDLTLKPVYANDTAICILSYPNEAAALVNPAAAQRRLQLIFHAANVTSSSCVSFQSGRRRYVCRPFVLEARCHGIQDAVVALELARASREPMPIEQIAQRFHLSRREAETIHYLVRGLTTKEVATRMSISPNTVKQFVRLIMGKMGVTTRAGIVGKLIDS